MSRGLNITNRNDEHARQRVALAASNQAQATDIALNQPYDLTLLGVQLRNAITDTEGPGTNPQSAVDSDIDIHCDHHNGQDLYGASSAVGWDPGHKEKTRDDASDPGGNHVMARTEIEVHLMLQRSSQAPAIKYTVLLSTNVPVLQLKKSQEHKLEVPHMRQRWFFKNIELDNNETIGDSNIRTNDFIHVQLENQENMALL